MYGLSRKEMRNIKVATFLPKDNIFISTKNQVAIIYIWTGNIETADILYR